MRKIELIAAISAKSGIPKVDVLVIVEALFSEIKQAVAQGKTVSLRKFGTFTVKKRAGRKARNIHKNEGIYVEEHFIPKFLPSKEFKLALRNVHPV